MDFSFLLVVFFKKENIFVYNAYLKIFTYTLFIDLFNVLKIIAFFDIQKPDNGTILSPDPKYIFWKVSSGVIQNNSLSYVTVLHGLCNTAIFLLQLI